MAQDSSYANTHLAKNDEPWCPARTPLIMSSAPDHVTCLECLNLALDQAIRDNDSVTAAALIDHRKLLPNHKARRVTRREAERTTKVPPVVHMRDEFGGSQCGMFGMPRACLSIVKPPPFPLITCRDCLLAELRECVKARRFQLADIVIRRCYEISSAEHAFGWNGTEWTFDFKAGLDATATPSHPAKRSRERMREYAEGWLRTINADAIHLAADILYLLEESETLRLELTQAQTNLGREKVKSVSSACMLIGIEGVPCTATQAGLPFVISVRNCSRCNGDHEKITFRRILNPDDRGNWYGLCPTTEQPILLTVNQRA